MRHPWRQSAGRPARRTSNCGRRGSHPQWEHAVDDIAEEGGAARAATAAPDATDTPAPVGAPMPAGRADAAVGWDRRRSHADGVDALAADIDTLADTVKNDDEDDDDTEGSDDNSHNTGVDADPAGGDESKPRVARSKATDAGAARCSGAA